MKGLVIHFTHTKKKKTISLASFQKFIIVINMKVWFERVCFFPVPLQASISIVNAFDNRILHIMPQLPEQQPAQLLSQKDQYFLKSQDLWHPFAVLHRHSEAFYALAQELPGQ